MRIVHAFLLPCLLTPIVGQAGDIDTIRTRQQQLQNEIRQLQHDQSEDQTRLQRLKERIEQQRKRNRALDEQLQQASDKAPNIPKNMQPEGE